MPCYEITPGDAEPQTYLDRPAQPQDLPGAQPPEVEELHEEQLPPVPTDPDAVPAPAPEPVTIPVGGATGEQRPDDVVLYRDVITVEGSASALAEPNVAVAGDQYFMTWNWGAARSFDAGTTMRYIDPRREFRTAEGVQADGGFCCDQLVEYLPEHGIWVWLLQYRTRLPEHRGNNRLRIAVAHGDEPFSKYWDLFPQQSPGVPSDAWLDFPQMAATASHLFVTVNAFRPEEEFSSGPVIYRLALTDLVSGNTTTPDCLYQPGLSAITPARQATNVMYLATMASNTTLSVWQWPDQEPEPDRYAVANYRNGTLESWPAVSRGGFSCPPDGVLARAADWCRRSDPRLLTGWVSDNLVGFAWNVPQSDAGTERCNPASRATDAKCFPYVWVQILDATKLATCATGDCVVARPHIFRSDTAFQYPSITTNERGDLGFVALFGGGAYRQGCAVGTRSADLLTTDAGWKLNVAEQSETDPRDAAAGDYMDISRGPITNSWTAACVSVGGSGTGQTPSDLHFVQFGQRADLPDS